MDYIGCFPTIRIDIAVKSLTLSAKIVPIGAKFFLKILNHLGKGDSFSFGDFTQKSLPSHLHNFKFGKVFAEKFRVGIVWGMPVFKCANYRVLQSIGLSLIHIYVASVL